MSYFIDQFTNDKQVKKIKEYIAEQQGKLWNFKEALYQYLMLDVRWVKSHARFFVFLLFLHKNQL